MSNHIKSNLQTSSTPAPPPTPAEGLPRLHSITQISIPNFHESMKSSNFPPSMGRETREGKNNKSLSFPGQPGFFRSSLQIRLKAFPLPAVREVSQGENNKPGSSGPEARTQRDRQRIRIPAIPALALDLGDAKGKLL